MIKLIASDLDGTLLYGRDNSISGEMFDLIREMKQRGILFAAASGRQYHCIKKLFEPVWEDMIFISENGAAVFYQDKLIKAQEVPMEELLENVALVDADEHTQAVISSATTTYIRPKDPYYVQCLLNLGNRVSVVENWSDITEPCLKIGWWENKGADQRIDHWAKLIKPPAKPVTSGADWIDLLYPNCDKGAGIQVVMDHFGIKKEEIAAFGDNYNDIEMLEKVGYPIAMENGQEKIKKMCPYHTKRVEDSVREILNGTFYETFVKT